VPIVYESVAPPGLFRKYILKQAFQIGGGNFIALTHEVISDIVHVFWNTGVGVGVGVRVGVEVRVGVGVGVRVGLLRGVWVNF
jgi:GTP cyclohydrolase III